MQCKDCLHFDVCKDATIPNPEYKGEQPDKSKECRGFKNKADYAEVKHGEWDTTNTTQEGDKVDTFFHHHKECKFGYSDNDICGSPYCPECGARMDGKPPKEV